MVGTGGTVGAGRGVGVGVGVGFGSVAGAARRRSAAARRRGHRRRWVRAGRARAQRRRARRRPRAVVVARVATDRDDPAVAGAERVGLGELLRERHLARPPLAPGRAHDAAEAPAVAVVHHAQVEQVPELVQQHGSRLAHAGADVDRARAPAVAAAGGAGQRGAALRPAGRAAGHGRHRRARAQRRPRAARALRSVLATRPLQGRYPELTVPLSRGTGRDRWSGRGPGRAPRSRAA